ncbi:MAG: flagellar motor switch phosphatase FliY [Peptococcaceae bacterium]|jgi:flagellar motor switch protein FliN/FliY|nr:flagellar motor switch phosphatase FliY [Peptococcaceae bacterium]
MNSGMLSQEEIDALLGGSEEKNESVTDDAQNLNSLEMDALGEIANISMGTAATTLSLLLNKKVEITTPQVDITTMDEIRKQHPVPCVIVDVRYKAGIEGSNVLILSQKDGAIIVDLMMGGEGQVPDSVLSDLQLSGISEAMNQMMGSAATSMSQMFNDMVDITPPDLKLCDMSSDQDQYFSGEAPVVRIAFRMVVGTVIDSVLIQIYPLDVAKNVVSKLMKETQELQASIEPQVQTTEQSAAPAPAAQAESFSSAQAPSPQKPVAHVAPSSIQPAQFSPLQPGLSVAGTDNLGLIMDVPLQLSIELGKAKKTIKDILSLGPGSVIELDRLAGEPVDMIVNGKLIAKCEVVVMNEAFGVRITDIIQPTERVSF